MKWSMDTHKYISEITRKALQIMVAHGITSESEANEIDAVERDLAKAGVYRDYNGAKGRVRRALFTYFKAYNCLDSSERLTPIGKLYAENHLTIKEFSFHYILNYKYEDDEVEYYPARLVLTTLVKIHEARPNQSYLSSYDFSKIVECDGIDDITDAFVEKLLKAREDDPISVDERSIGYDVWAKMLIQAGILQKNADKNLVAVDYDLIQWILDNYEKNPTSERGKIATGVLRYIPVPSLVKPHGNVSELKNEGHALQAFLFDEIDDYTISKYIATVPFKETKEILGITEGLKGFYSDFVGLERLVGYCLAQNSNPSIKAVGEIIAGAELTESELVAIDDSDNDGNDVAAKSIDGVGENILFYGVPGSGKSHHIKTEYPMKRGHYERVVFHPDYTYSDFIGQVMPRLEKTSEGEKLRYVFNAGPFTKILAAALNDPAKEPYFLVIEEINRGNAPAIFGEIFQLLDRNNQGESEYGITNFDIAEYICAGEDMDADNYEVKIPSNLWILATMNTSDQNVFTLDTAFQRRWIMRHIANDFAKAKHASLPIEKSEISWGAFAEVINGKVLEASAGISSAEDKRLGAFFATERELKADRFPEKVLKYLWDDAFKMEPDFIFSDEMTSLDYVIETYKTSKTDALAQILRGSIYSEMMKKMGSKPKDVAEIDVSEE